MHGGNGLRCALTVAAVLGVAANAFAAEDGVWSVGKSSGDVWITTSGVEQVAVKREETLKPGDTIRTGRTGRVLLLRGEEAILITPNSVVGLPSEKKEGLSTTIVQQAGTILLEVEKRNVKHFEVETPYLAAVVKGTQFSVSVNAASTNVEVRRGQVEVSDFKTGQIARVMPGQAATVFIHGKTGLTLSGSGTFNPIEQGKPRASTIERIPVPKSGLSAPRDASNGRVIHAVGGKDKAMAGGNASATAQKAAGTTSAKAGVVRISNSLGEVKLNFVKVTHGLAHASVMPGSTPGAANKEAVWGDAKTSTAAASGGGQDSANGGNAAYGAANSAASAATVAGVVGAANSANARGNGASGNGNGNGNGAFGGGAKANGAAGNNGNGNGGNGNGGNGNNGNGNSGNGNNGNGNNGLGNAFGHASR